MYFLFSLQHISKAQERKRERQTENSDRMLDGTKMAQINWKDGRKGGRQSATGHKEQKERKDGRKEEKQE